MCHGCGQLYDTTGCPPHNSGGVRDSEFAHRVRMALSSCQQNIILFGWAGLTTPTRLGFLFQHTCVLLSSAMVFTTSTKHEEAVGTVLTAGTVPSTLCF